MKKLLLSLMAAGFAATSFAQMGNCAGGILLYGVGSYRNAHGSDTRSFSNANGTTIDRPRQLNWEVSPGLGFNITDNLSIGVDFNYTGSKTTMDRKDIGFPFNGYAVDQVKTFDYAVGPFVRYTMPIGEHFFWYGQLEAHYLRGRSTPRYTNLLGTNSFSRDDNYKGVDVSYMPAVGVVVCKNVALTFGIGGISYDYRKYEFNSDIYATAGSEHTAKTNNFDVSFGRQFNIGVQKTFGCHKMRHHAEPMDDTRHMDTSDDSSEDDDSSSRKRRRNRKNDDE
jgi:hypothetical protein